jgi:formylglycine-generating enzyme required for sulfatase activity/nitrate/TMAO reductase-like tetraheme cytochrome c subunit
MKNRFIQFFSSRKKSILFLGGMATILLLIYPFNKIVDYTSTNEYCFSCHVHDHAEASWRLSPHLNNASGVITNCVDCHLPPKGHGHILAKAKHGIKDVYGFLFKDSADYNWEGKRNAVLANKFTYQSSCLKCHSNLYPSGLTQKGIDSHLHFDRNRDEMTCLNCHMHTGHFDPNYQHAQNLAFADTTTAREIYSEPAKIKTFDNFTEFIPGSSVSFEMVAIPSGTFFMGSPDDEQFRKKDEGPVRKVIISRFFMGQVEVSWDEFLAWFNATASEGRISQSDNQVVDAFSGATPPWGAPDQGWGKGKMPAITMTHHAAMQYCRWLSEVTGKKYRLPTEAEWEYAARSGTQTPYYFEGNPRQFSQTTFLNKIFGADTSVISSHAIYKTNSNSRTASPAQMQKNPFGLINMLGNVSEFCLDWYFPDTYEQYEGEILTNPRAPKRGKERVIRGGSFLNDAAELRVAARDYTKTQDWLKTDPQIPKSIWWYSDCTHVGFRVVCEADSELDIPEN